MTTPIYGNAVGNHSTGLVELIHKGLVDIGGTVLAKTVGRSGVISFVSLFNDCTVIAYQKHWQRSDKAFIEVFSVMYWAMVMLTITMLSAAICFTLMVSTNDLVSKKSRMNKFLHSVVVTTAASGKLNFTHLIPQHQFHTKVLIFTTTIFGFLNLSVYEGGLISNLMSKK